MSEAKPTDKPATASKPRRRRLLRRSRLGQYIALLVVVGTLVGAAWFGWRAYDQLVRYPLRAGSGSSAVVSLEVPRGSSFPQVLAQLVEAGVEIGRAHV